MSAYTIGVGVIALTPRVYLVALCVTRNADSKVIGPWRVRTDNAHDAAMLAIERADRIKLRDERVIMLRQQSVVRVLGRADVRWSSDNAPEGEHWSITRAVEAVRQACGVPV